MPSTKKPSLTAAARAAFTAIKASAPKDRFYFFALFTTEDGSYVTATAWSEEAFERAVAGANRGKRTDEELRRALRFSAPDSPFHDVQSEVFAGFASGKKLHDACFDAMRELDFDGFFGKGTTRSKTLINVVYGDMSDERWYEHADRLNSRAALARVVGYLHLHRPTGKVEAWGAKAYQVNALSLSADRARVAYCGSGGEVGILEVANRKPIYEKRRDGEHWACALEPEGTRLYLGDRDGIIVLDPETPKTPTPFAKTGKPCVLAVSGAHLAASSWSAPLRMWDRTTGKKLWEDKSIKKAGLAFSPNGEWLAVADGTRLACFESATGTPRWSFARTRDLADDGVAWKSSDEILDGTRIVAAKSGKQTGTLPWPGRVSCVAVSPKGARVAIASSETVVILDAKGNELARGTGTQEDFIACAFLDEATVLVVGRDVNRGPALLTLRA